MIPQIAGVTQDGKLTYSYVQDIRKVWPIVREGVETIIKANHESFMPEDVFHACALGNAAMFIFMRATGEYAGFGVFHPYTFPFQDKPCLNIWLGYSKEPEHGPYGVEVAKAVLAESPFDRAVFSTPQEGWPERYGTKLHSWYEVN